MKKQALKELAELYAKATNDRNKILDVVKLIIANDYTIDVAECIDNEVDYIINRYDDIRISLLRIMTLDKLYGYKK